MRKKFTESRTYEEAYKIGEQRIKDAIDLYDYYRDQGGDYFIERPCPFCGETEYTEEEAFQKRYGVARCKRCHSLYVNPCPTQDVLNDYYNNYECNNMLEKVYKERAEKPENAILDSRIETIIHYIEKIERKQVRILEVGCSNGSFLSKLKERVKSKEIKKEIVYIGVDTNSNAIKACKDKELQLVSSTIEDYLEDTQEKFDIIWHSELIEHLIDPFSVFKKMNNAMRKDSFMIFTTPNDASVEMKNITYNVPRVLACNILPPMHLNAFSTENISHFVMRSGFCVEDISTPGEFDVEIFEMEKEYINDEKLLSLEFLDEKEKELIQNIIVMSGGSSHMQCVIRK